ncbi:small nuclear ribonucleoprotein f [Plasmopara halstedii]|uniref:Small nuclear ribonucleoprotein f n=1 Tax=Plasmopara halstedii TaxID=4781 RepID=A0A0P1AGH7_PLAHL|nr:small nuclear ribonucleoprotein f [Plasmopara halstedii]CEG39861.1 small nuclear ribonucleoprotein f [Plasmopara halstedii]|eukprot:XP_024576230.1 small nuclear ribonucleoprotein f [Plasmopara halstedii]
MSGLILNPKPFLTNLTGKPVVARLKWEEYINGELTGNLGETLVRCNNVLFIRGLLDDEKPPAEAPTNDAEPMTDTH